MSCVLLFLCFVFSLLVFCEFGVFGFCVAVCLGFVCMCACGFEFHVFVVVVVVVVVVLLLLCVLGGFMFLKLMFLVWGVGV